MLGWLLALWWTVLGGLMGLMAAFPKDGFYEQITTNHGKAVFAFVMGAIVAWLIAGFVTALEFLSEYEKKKE